VIVLLAACGSSHGADDDAGVDATPGVSSHTAPPRPSVADGASGPDAVFVLNEVRWDQAEDWERIGFDLDGLATSPPDGEAECVAPSPDGPVEPDGFGGTDNAAGHNILPLLLTIVPDAQAGARALQAEGIGALLVRIREWNGADDDPRVTGDFLLGTVGRDPEGAFLVSESAFLGGDIERPRASDDNAYVAGGALVMRLPDRAPIDIAFGGTTLPIVLTDVLLVVRLDGDATLAGRWSIPDVIEAVPRIGVCRGTADDGVLLRALDLSADIRMVPGTGGPGASCEALSLGLAFSVAPATFAGIGPSATAVPPCPP
jgi:hypothetical protein